MFCTPPPRPQHSNTARLRRDDACPLHLYDGTSAACTKKEMADNKDAFEAHVNKRICDHSCERRPCIRRVAAMAWRSITWRSAIRRRRDGPAPTQDDREDVNAVFMDKYPKAILIESGIALVILALSKAGIGPLAEKFRKEGD